MYQKILTVKLVGISPLSFGKKISSPRNEGESHDEHEKRTWRERTHRDRDGVAFIPPMALKKVIDEAAKRCSDKITGRGNTTYTKFVSAGIMLVDPIMLGVMADGIPGEWLNVPSDGKVGGTKRVDRCFPTIQSWEGKATIYIVDPILRPELIQKYLVYGGQFVGLLRFRPASMSAGYYGRFVVKDVKVQDETAQEAAE